jgi:hypothetical protein
MDTSIPAACQPESPLVIGSDSSDTSPIYFIYSSRDKTAVRELAEKLIDDGVNVWLDKFRIEVSDRFPEKLDCGLESSRAAIICLSEAAKGSEWVWWEINWLLANDPGGYRRRLIILQMDESAIPPMLKQYQCLSWMPEYREDDYPRLLAACRDQPAHALPHPPPVEHRSKWIRRLGVNSKTEAFAFFQGGAFALTGCSSENQIRLWDMESGDCLREYSGHTSGVWALSISPRERFFVSGSDDKTCRIWDIESARCLHVLNGHTANLRSVAWCPTRPWVATGGNDQTIQIWDVDSGVRLNCLKGHTDAVREVRWSEDGTQIFSSGKDRMCRIWDAVTGLCLKTLVGHSDSVRSIAPSRDLQLALSGGNDTVLRLWDLATGRTKKVLIGHEQSIRDVIWCLDQRFVLSGASDKEIRVWNVDSGRCVAKLVGHQYDIRQICETADSHLISGDSQGIIHFWSLRDIFATQVVG